MASASNTGTAVVTSSPSFIITTKRVCVFFITITCLVVVTHLSTFHISSNRKLSIYAAKVTALANHTANQPANGTAAILAAHRLSYQESQKLSGELAKYFSYGLTPGQRAIYVDLVQKFAAACEKHKVVYMLYWGSLLGAFRHHGIIPWDDEIDIWVAYQDRKKLNQVVHSMGADFVLYAQQGIRYKVANRKKSWKAGVKAWRWPFLDVCFYAGNSTHIWDTTQSDWLHSRKEVFPTKLRPFEGLWLRTPLKLEQVLRKHWTVETCCSRGFNHAKEFFIRNICRPCSQLKPFYHFVQRTKSSDHTAKTPKLLETLTFQKKMLWNVTIAS